jgi:hypothetical protein
MFTEYFVFQEFLEVYGQYDKLLNLIHTKLIPIHWEAFVILTQIWFVTFPASDSIPSH